MTLLLSPKKLRSKAETSPKNFPNAGMVLDHSGWEKVAFTGRWPLGIVEYSDPASPLTLPLGCAAGGERGPNRP